ncbi:M17 family metallopeptidase [Mycoplasma sp. CSL7475-4]|uniref:M17 family metallopeptidase n=1 Tax=Mycoplasma sp. CSL7475-4 TaxID=2973942 RepID=UPI00216B1559|nr:M17 family metallopeptidase [Mycoplasma sp. CSL7475-4]MCS4536779.1 M17 family metallopeptidase [Mycoplasma sp. CSL7475-4]
MIKYYSTFRNENFLLKAVCGQIDHEISPKISTKNGAITEFIENKEAFIYIEKDLNYDQLLNFIDKFIVTSNRNYQIDLKTFVTKKLDMDAVIKAFYSKIFFYEAVLFNKKKEAPEKKQFTFLLPDASFTEIAQKYAIIALNKNSVRNLQVMPENFLNSETLADVIKEEFEQNEDLKVTVLRKNDISDLGMGLILSVNKGSTHAPRVVVIEYNGNPDSDEKIVYVGKGITFDTGGMNTKGYHMEGMKYDMSGSVITAYTVKTAAELKIKKNLAAVMCITDNRQDGDASLPENVYDSMAGISVEVTDTDAEGRLVLADGLYYGATVLNATTLVDVATLTGAMVRTLGLDYSGIWSTDEQNWKIFEKAAKIAREKVWRMPLHEDFHEPNTASIVADLNNYNNDETSDHNTAAMFLKEFTNNVPYIHCDIAGTADRKGKPMGALLDTLVEFAIQK